MITTQKPPQSGLPTRACEVTGLRRLDLERFDPSQLERAFGPQGDLVIAMSRRASKLTHDELDELWTAWEESLPAAWLDDPHGPFTTPSWVAAAREAAGSAGRTYRIAEEVALGAWEPGLAALYGLIARDLVGRFGFTQEHYDRCTGPWRRVVGALHPDDEVWTKPAGAGVHRMGVHA